MAESLKLAPGDFFDGQEETKKVDGFDPRSIYSPMQFIETKPDENATPEEKIRFRTDRQAAMAQYIAYLLDEEDCMKWADQWVRVFPSEWPEEWQFHTPFRSTVWEELIASLEGYCVQENFDSVVSRLSPDHKSSILQIFATTFLMKTAIEKFFKHPFWYVEALPMGTPGEYEEAPWQGVSPEGALLERLLSRFEEVHPKYARIWRNVTNRLCNATYREHGEDITFGKALKARRQARCYALAKQMLADKVFQCMLKSTDDFASREKDLGSALANMVEVIVPMLSQDPILKFRMLDEIEPQFHDSHKGMEADFHHYLDPETDDRHRLDGQRVLIIQYPFAVKIWSNAKEGEEDTVCKASAIMEDCGQQK
ncbi:hypothetical protein BDV18DRAFT_160163 [Aspergillus unguis]